MVSEFLVGAMALPIRLESAVGPLESAVDHHCTGTRGPEDHQQGS